jgi:hypothetical protein
MLRLFNTFISIFIMQCEYVQELFMLPKLTIL